MGFLDDTHHLLITARYSPKIVMEMLSFVRVDVFTHSLRCLPDILPIQSDGLVFVWGFSHPDLLDLSLRDFVEDFVPLAHSTILASLPLHTMLSIPSYNTLFIFFAKWVVHRRAHLSSSFSS